MGEADREDLSGNLIVQLRIVTEVLNRAWYERNSGRAITDVQRRVKHSAIPWMAATLDGIVSGTGAVFEIQVHVAVVVLRGGRSRKVHGAAAAQHVGQPLQAGSPVDHHRRREVGGDHNSAWTHFI